MNSENEFPREEFEKLAGIEDTKEINKKKYKIIYSGIPYTMKQFYSHETPEKGPGPGWDYRWAVLEIFGIWEPDELPDEPHYYIYAIENQTT